MLLVEFAAVSPLGSGPSRDVVAQRCELLLPLLFCLANSRSGDGTDAFTGIGESNYSDGRWIVRSWRRLIIGKRGAQNSLHSEQEAEPAEGRSAENQPASGDVFHTRIRWLRRIPDSIVQIQPSQTDT